MGVIILRGIAHTHTHTQKRRLTMFAVDGTTNVGLDDLPLAAAKRVVQKQRAHLIRQDSRAMPYEKMV